MVRLDWSSQTNQRASFPLYFLSMIDGLWTIGNIQTEDLNGVTLEPRENLFLIWENILRPVILKSLGT